MSNEKITCPKCKAVLDTLVCTVEQQDYYKWHDKYEKYMKDDTDVTTFDFYCPRCHKSLDYDELCEVIDE